MGEYEKYNLSQLQDDPSIDPDDPAVLFAKACCFLLGDGGVEEANQEVCIKLLKKAAALGNEEARKELKSLKSAESNAPDASEQEDYSKKGLEELTRLAEAGNLRAVIEACGQCDYFGLDKRKEEYLELGINAIKKGTRRQDDLCREVSEMSGNFYKKRKEMEKSRECYEIARIFDSIDARLELMNFYAEGIGGKPNPDMENKCAEELKEKGQTERLRYAVWCRAYGKHIEDGISIVHEVIVKTEDPELREWATTLLNDFKKMQA